LEVGCYILEAAERFEVLQKYLLWMEVRWVSEKLSKNAAVFLHDGTES
jgi:hypothetical protein